jgi:hypothetical protein
MAAKYRGLRAWIAAASVASVIGGTAYFAHTANSQTGTTAPADASGQISGPVAGAANATTSAQRKSTPVPVKAKRSRGS